MPAWPRRSTASSPRSLAPTGSALKLPIIEDLQGIALVAATICMGLMAGVFWVYSHAIMRGLGWTDDRTFVGTFQAIDRAIVNPMFVFVFAGALLLTAAAVGLSVAEDEGDVLPWTIAALGLYLAVVVITFIVNVPANNAIKAEPDPDRIGDLAAVRARFNEARWNGSNLFRTIATTAAFGCLLWALVEYGRAF